MSSKEFIEKSAAAAAATTGHMILDNMLERTIGKKLSMLTIPTFIITLSVYGGYYVSDMIDPDKGKDRFTYAIMNPADAGSVTALIVADQLGRHGGVPDIAKPVSPVFNHSHYSYFRDNIWNPLVTLSRY